MFAILIIVSVNVFIAYRWFKENPNGYAGNKNRRRQLKWN